MLKLLAPCLLLINISAGAFLQKNEVGLDTRIVGGDATDILNFPYQVVLEYNTNYRCGGAIIARTWILTGANCFDGLGTIYPQNFRIRVGSSYPALGGQLINLSNFILHSNLSSDGREFDIALAQLAEPITLSRTAQIIALPDGGDPDIEGLAANVSGWGSTTEGGGLSSILRVVEVPIINRSVCGDLYPEYRITENLICAGFYEGGKDACSGDGGSPLVIDSVLYGIVSWGQGCARPLRPGVYTNVGALRDWITEKTGI